MREYLKELSIHLISLKDNGFHILNNETKIRIENDRPFKYSEVKDDLIPFIYLMRKDHDIEIRITGHTRFKLFGLIKPKYTTNRVSINSIVNDTYRTDLGIREIDIIISKKMPEDIRKFIDDFSKKY